MNLPKLETRFVFHLSIEVGAIHTAGDTGFGTRRVIPILGGTVRGEGVNGNILPFGADYQIVRPSGFIELEAKYVFQLDDGATVYIENRGVRFASLEVLEHLNRGEAVDPALVYFRSLPRFETGNGRYRWLMEHLFVATGARLKDRVELDVYQVI